MAKYSDLTLQRGTRDSADAISQEKPLEISNKIWMTDPNTNKALGYMLSNSGKAGSGRRVFGHLEDAPYPNWIIYAGPDEATQKTSSGLEFVAGAGERCAAGSRVIFPEIDEIIRFTADFTDTDSASTYARNFGRGVAATSLLLTGMKGFIIPPAFYEGFTTGKGMSSTLYYKSFDMTELSYPIQVTYVDQHEKSRAGKPFERGLKKEIKHAKDQMEGELFLGGQVTDNSTYDHPIGASDGIDNYVTTHAYTADRISRMDFFDILLEWNTWYSGEGVIFCSTAFKSMVTQWALNVTHITIPVSGQKGEGKLGLSIDKVEWLHATYDLIDVHLFGQELTLIGKVFMVPKGKAKYRFLEGLDIHYAPIARDEVHAKEGELYGVYGWEFFEEERWAKISGLRF